MERDAIWPSYRASAGGTLHPQASATTHAALRPAAVAALLDWKRSTPNDGRRRRAELLRQAIAAALAALGLLAAANQQFHTRAAGFTQVFVEWHNRSDK